LQIREFRLFWRLHFVAKRGLSRTSDFGRARPRGGFISRATAGVAND
jgi:hypothetical protein